MAITTRYYNANGTGIDDCVYLAQRYDDERGFKPEDGECWVITHSPGKKDPITLWNLFGTTGWLTGVWRSPAGVVYVSGSSSGAVHVNPDILHKDTAKKWKDHDLGQALDGVWGLDDKFVLSWAGSFEGKNYLFCFDGKKWKELPVPEFGIRAVHGLDRDLIYAVGEDGGVARWDGGQWKQFPTPTEEILLSVFVAGPDEIYATGSAGSLLEGSSQGWGKIASAPAPKGPLLAVAKWNDELWVAGGGKGLCKRDGKKNKLKVVKPNAKANSFCVGEKLLIGTEDFIGETADGENFQGAGAGFLQQVRDGFDLGDM
jgi:hypothetical protein